MGQGLVNIFDESRALIPPTGGGSLQHAMALVHPVVDPSIVLNASVGNFLGDSRRWVALQYSNRIVFKQILCANKTNHPVKFGDDDICIVTPQPPMTMGNPDEDVLPTLGGVFFTAGRRSDLLVLQVASTLVFVSVNGVDLKLDLEGSWGLPMTEGRGAKVTPASSGTHTPVKRPASSMSLVSLAETGMDPFVASIGTLNKNINTQLSQLQVSRAIGLHPDMPPPRPSPDGTQIFLATRNKNKDPVLVIISCYGKELLRLEVEYIDIMTLGWINNDVVYFVYMNSKFHKKFQTASVGSKAKTSGLFGMGRRVVVPSLVYDVNVVISPDFNPSRSIIGGGPDLVFQDYVLLGTRRGTYLRVNHKTGTWEPVANASNVVGAVSTGENRLIVMNTRGKRSAAAPTEFSYALATDGGLRRVQVSREIGMCLSSGHSIDSENRFVLKLLNIGHNCILDYKRQPCRTYMIADETLKIIDSNPLPSASSAKLTSDFIIKTEQALYTRDPNGVDSEIVKVVERDIYSIVLDRPGLRGLEKRGDKSMWATFSSIGEYSPEVRILEESHKILKLKTKAHYTFTHRKGWQLTRLVPVYRNIALVTIGLVKEPKQFTDDATELLSLVGDFKKWEIYLVNFVGALSKSDPVKPRAHLILESRAPEIPPTPLALPGSISVTGNERKKLAFHVYNAELNGFTTHTLLTVWDDGKFETNVAKAEAEPFALHESDEISFFTDFKTSSDGIFLVGMQSPKERRITHVLTVESPGASFSKPIVLFNKDLHRSVIWLFDSNGTAFREFALDVIPLERARHYEHQEKVLLQAESKNHLYSLSSDFRRKYFREVAGCDDFRPLPELLSRVCAGSGVDAEAYVKTPDNGIFAVFRMQNKKLLEGFRRLEMIVNEKCVGSWLPDVLKEQWLSERKVSTMVSGSAIAALWRFDIEKQKQLCDEADFDYELLKKVCPP